MGFNDSSQAGLVLGLGFSSPATEDKPKTPPGNNFDFNADTSLTLSLYDLEKKQDSHGGASSLSSNKRYYSSSRLSDEDDDGSNGRKKLRLTKSQSALLEDSFKKHVTLNPIQKKELARELKLTPRQIEVWFQNRRARTKLKQTEVDCQYFKKFCDTLRNENRRLQKSYRLSNPDPHRASRFQQSQCVHHVKGSPPYRTLPSPPHPLSAISPSPARNN